MSCFFGSAIDGKAPLQRVDDRPAIVDRQRGLTDEREPLRIGDLQTRDIVDRLHQMDRPADLPHGALDLGMPGMADHHDVPALAVHPRDFDVHLGDERAGRVEDAQTATLGMLANRLRHPVRREDHGGAVRNLVEIVDEHGALRAQIGHHMVVVNDLVAHEDRRAVDLQRTFDDRDRAIDPGAESARLREERFHHLPPSCPSCGRSNTIGRRVGSTRAGTVKGSPGSRPAGGSADRPAGG